MSEITTEKYNDFFAQIKNQVSKSQSRAAQYVNKELILLYHAIGLMILKSQEENAWGAKIIDKLSQDLKSEFPQMKGFSPRSLKYMRKFAQEYPDYEFVQAPLAQLTWYHNITLIDKISDKRTRLFYIKEAIENNWSRNVMVSQIEAKLHQRKGKAITNFDKTLESTQSELANNILKDPYIFDFLNLGKQAHEREMEKNLVQYVEKFLLELGAGFAFVGRQYHLEIADQDFYIDLLFYHIKLRSFIIIELKDQEFKPEYAGKMNFYLSAVDDLLKHESDNPSIGLILCKTKNNVLAEYALRDMSKPIGLSEYRIDKAIPENIKSELPTIEELEAYLKKI